MILVVHDRETHLLKSIMCTYKIITEVCKQAVGSVDVQIDEKICDVFSNLPVANIRHVTQIDISNATYMGDISNATYMGTYEIQHELQNLVDIAIFKRV